MRKILFIILLALMILIFGFTVAKGIDVANITVLSYPQIKERNEDVRVLNDKLTSKVETDYPKAISDLEESERQLKATKEEYESLIALSSSESGYTAAIEKYEIEYLWTRIGNHAKDNDVDMKIDLTSSSMGTGFYKLNFTVSGSYVGITDFIYSIENDSKLGFKIDNFVMTPNSSGEGVGELKATFSCDEVGINLKSIESQTTTNSATNATTNNTNTNTNTNSTTSSNTTKSNTAGGTNTSKSAGDMLVDSENQ